MWLFADDDMTIINMDNAESIEVNGKSVYINMVGGKTHLYGRYTEEAKAADVLCTVRSLLNSCS